MKTLQPVIQLIALLLLLLGCDTPRTDKPQIESGILSDNMDTLVNPADNFYAYVNGNWIATNEIPADKSSYGVFSILYDKSIEDIKRIIEEVSTGSYEKNSDEQRIGDLYKSYLNMERRNELGTQPLEGLFSKIDSIKDHDDLASFYGHMKWNYIEAPIMFYISQGLKDPTQYRAIIYQGGLGLPNRDYYTNNDSVSKDLLEKYEDHVNNMLSLSGIADPKKTARTIIALETELARAHMEKEKTRDQIGNYKVLSLDSLKLVMPRFNWDGYLKEADISGQDTLGVLTLDYLKKLDQIISSTDLDAWKLYLKWKVIHHYSTYLSEDLDLQHFKFYLKQLYGSKERKPRWRRGVETVNSKLGELMGKAYVKEHFKPEAKERMLEMIANLTEAYRISIMELDWMSEETKSEALNKLSKFRSKIGYPDQWKEYEIDIRDNDLFGNISRSTAYEYKQAIDKLGQPINKEEWFTTPQTVNAFYDPSANEIVFPAAILQPPFFNMSADDAVNYGAIGAAIGHEIGHGFDDTGSTYDGDGALRNWWTDQDRIEFEKRTGQLIDQFNEFEVLPGLYVNGEYTQGENIGDLGGLSIGLKAYYLSLEGKEPPVLDGFTGKQRYFIGWAQVWKNKSREEYVRNIIKSDMHSPDKFRVNGVVRNIPEFYSAFNVTEKDSLYLDSDKRVKIW